MVVDTPSVSSNSVYRLLDRSSSKIILKPMPRLTEGEYLAAMAEPMARLPETVKAPCLFGIT